MRLVAKFNRFIDSYIDVDVVVLSSRLCRHLFCILHENNHSSLLNTLPMQVFTSSSRLHYPPSHHPSDYGDMTSGPLRSYNTTPDQRAQGQSPDSSSSSPSTGPPVSLGRFSKAASRSPPSRQRTPIRHHRPSNCHSQSAARAEALLAFATQQEAQATASQSMASSQSSFPPSAYMMPTAASSYPVQDGYFTTAGMPPQPHGGNYLLGSSTYDLEPNPSTYFGIGRSASFPLDPLSSMAASKSVYHPQGGPNAASGSWPSSATPSHLTPAALHSPDDFTLSAASSTENPDGIRVLASRPKPQCFDHGCNGRQFSTFSNLLRHQREKSGSASKAVCPHCGTEFTRTTARNGHLYGGKCKGRDGQGGSEPEVPEQDDLIDP